MKTGVAQLSDLQSSNCWCAERMLKRCYLCPYYDHLSWNPCKNKIHNQEYDDLLKEKQEAAKKLVEVHNKINKLTQKILPPNTVTIVQVRDVEVKPERKTLREEILERQLLGSQINKFA